jgi:hypothetical protein
MFSVIMDTSIGKPKGGSAGGWPARTILQSALGSQPEVDLGEARARGRSIDAIIQADAAGGVEKEPLQHYR